MDDRVTATIGLIATAFATRNVPADAPMFTAYSPELEADRLSALAAQSGWRDLPWQLLSRNSSALALATPAAFAYFLPAAMTGSLTHYVECGALTSMLLTCLTPQDDSDVEMMAQLERDFEELEPGFLGEGSVSGVFARDEEADEDFNRRIASLTDAERQAVRAYLRCLDDLHGADFPVFGPREALERFWAAPDRDGAHA